ncbi:MAG: DUF6011 domain-containing protein [Bacteroidales bacterium]|jgi:hypothetical protein
MAEFSLNAKYPGTCIKCHGAVNIDDEIFWDNETRKVRHVACPENPVLVQKQPPVEISDGIYLFEGSVYKVQHAVHASGMQYTKQLVRSDYAGREARFKKVTGIISKLQPEHKMTLEQAAEYGALYGVCCNCGRTLTNEGSIEAGIGPVCLGHFFADVSKQEQQRLARVAISQGIAAATAQYKQK